MIDYHLGDERAAGWLRWGCAFDWELHHRPAVVSLTAKLSAPGWSQQLTEQFNPKASLPPLEPASPGRFNIPRTGVRDLAPQDLPVKGPPPAAALRAAALHG